MARVKVKNVKIGDIVKQPGSTGYKVLKIEKNVVDHGQHYAYVLVCHNRVRYRFTTSEATIDVIE